jgi:hypothetical protein
MNPTMMSFGLVMTGVSLKLRSQKPAGVLLECYINNVRYF